jgi:hypothetical protein
MQLPPFRERTPERLCEQARKHRESARLAGDKEADMLRRLAERYETLADLKASGALDTPVAFTVR